MQSVYENSTAGENELKYSLNIPAKTFSLSTKDQSEKRNVEERIDNIVSRNFYIKDDKLMRNRDYNTNILYLKRPEDPFYGLDDSSGVTIRYCSNAIYNSFLNGDKPISEVVKDINEVKNTGELNIKCSELNQSGHPTNNTRPRQRL